MVMEKNDIRFCFLSFATLRQIKQHNKHILTSAHLINQPSHHADSLIIIITSPKSNAVAKAQAQTNKAYS